jgi:hypothetical protein
MVKRVKITYVGGTEKIIQYSNILRDTKDERVYLDTVGTHVTVIKANVLQIRELS